MKKFSLFLTFTILALALVFLAAPVIGTGPPDLNDSRISALISADTNSMIIASVATAISSRNDDSRTISYDQFYENNTPYTLEAGTRRVMTTYQRAILKLPIATSARSYFFHPQPVPTQKI